MINSESITYALQDILEELKTLNKKVSLSNENLCANLSAIADRILEASYGISASIDSKDNSN